MNLPIAHGIPQGEDTWLPLMLKCCGQILREKKKIMLNETASLDAQPWFEVNVSVTSDYLPWSILLQ